MYRMLWLCMLLAWVAHAQLNRFPTRPIEQDTKQQVINVLDGLALTASGLNDTSLQHLLAVTRQLVLKAALDPSRLYTTSDASKPPSSSTPSRISFSLTTDFFATNKMPWRRHNDRLQQPVNATVIADFVEKQLNPSGMFAKTLIPVHDPAGAWIVSPSEWNKLSSVGVTMDELEEIAKVNYVAYTQMTPICLARYQLPQTGNATQMLNAIESVDNHTLSASSAPDEAVYLRVTAKEWRMVRSDVAKLVAKKLSDRQNTATNGRFGARNDTSPARSPGPTAADVNPRDVFDADHFRPFILLGSTLPDLVEHISLGDMDDWCWAEIRKTSPADVAKILAGFASLPSEMATSQIVHSDFALGPGDAPRHVGEIGINNFN